MSCQRQMTGVSSNQNSGSSRNMGGLSSIGFDEYRSPLSIILQTKHRRCSRRSTQCQCIPQRPLLARPAQLSYCHFYNDIMWVLTSAETSASFQNLYLNTCALAYIPSIP